MEKQQFVLNIKKIINTKKLNKGGKSEQKLNTYKKPGTKNTG